MVRRPREAMVRCDAKVEKALGKPVLEDGDSWFGPHRDVGPPPTPLQMTENK